jgi:hypothetical protein
MPRKRERMVRVVNITPYAPHGTDRCNFNVRRDDSDSDCGKSSVTAVVLTHADDKDVLTMCPGLQTGGCLPRKSSS